MMIRPIHPCFKIFASLMIGLLFCMSYAGISAYAAQQKPIKFIVKGETIDLAVKPIIVNGSVMLPMKSVFDAVHMTSSLDKHIITVHNGTSTFKAAVNQKLVYAGTHQVRLAQEPIIQNGRLFVPVRFVALVLDQEVTYDPQERQVVIGYTAKSMLGFQKALFEAAIHGDAASAEKMLKRGVDADVKLVTYYLDNTPLDYAVLHNNTNVARVLLDHGATIEAAGQDLAFRAILHQNAELLDLLLTAGLDPNEQGNTGSLLESASGLIYDMGDLGDGQEKETIIHPSYAAVKVLLNHGADPGIDNSLSRAVQAKNYDIIKALLAAGADPYRANRDGTTPYELSLYYGVGRMLTADERPDIPTLQFINYDGAIMSEGGFTLHSADTDDYKQFDWLGGLAYVDGTSGRYNISNVNTYRFTWLRLPDAEINIKEGSADPFAIQLPKLNISGTVTVDGSDADNEGMLEIVDNVGNGIGLVQVAGSRFDFYLPEGQYSILNYRAADRVYSVNQPLTVGGDGETLTISVSATSE